MKIKCVDPTQFESKEWEYHSYGGWEWKWGNENKIHFYFYISIIFSYFPNYPHSSHN